MKTLKLFVFIVFLALGTGTGKAQYQPLAVENAAWLIHDYWMLPFSNINAYWGYLLSGDTTINGTDYKKVYSFNCGIDPTFPLHSGPLTLTGFVRDSNQKVYAIKIENSINCPTNTEYVLFDFSYNIGDTVKLCSANYPNCPEKVVIDNISPNEPPFNRKTFYGNQIAFFYEGIGSWRGFLEDLALGTGDINYHLENYSANGIAGLGIITGIDNNDENKIYLEILPNPFDNEFSFNYKISANTKTAIFELIDEFGRLVYQTPLNTSENKREIVTENLLKGVYLGCLKLDGVIVATKKIIKSDN